MIEALFGLIILGVLFCVYASVFLLAGWLLSLFYNHMADKFHWGAHIAFWEMAVLIFIVAWVISKFQPKAVWD